MSRIEIPEDLANILSIPKLSKSFLVGGCVRDFVMGFEPKDFDVEVFDIDYDELAVILDNWGRVDIVGKSFGVIKLTKGGHTYDFNLPRMDSKIRDGHRGFRIRVDHGLTLREAAARRDFTINALSYDPRTEEIIDNFGGIADIENKILRHIGESFKDDPLRVLRGMQFVSRFGLTPVPVTLAVCASMHSKHSELSVERIWNEWYKWGSMSTKPSLGIKFLNKTGWITHYPALAPLRYCEQDPEWHPEGNAFEHTLHCCDALVKQHAWQWKGAAERAMLSLAVLCHDIGKPLTTETVERDGVERIVSPGHDSIGATMAKSFLGKMGAPDEVKKQVANLVQCHMAHLSEPGKRSVRRLAARLHPATIEQLLMVMEADHDGRPPLPGGLPPFAQRIGELASEMKIQDSTPKPLLLGRHLIELGLQPGPDFKRLLTAFFEKQLDGDFDNLEDGKFLLKKAIDEEAFGCEPEIGLWEP